MSSNKPEAYVPYRKDTRENSNDITVNEGAGSTQPAPLNGWREQNFEQNTFDRGKK
ncbi:MAG: hypothetical protein ABSA80_10185 [Terriglobales bacterium]|jgi:hypothetical protein